MPEVILMSAVFGASLGAAYVAQRGLLSLIFWAMNRHL